MFQRALQLETIAFSPDVEQQHLPAQPVHGSESHCAHGARRPEPPTTATGAVEGLPAKRRASTCGRNAAWPGQEPARGKRTRTHVATRAPPRLLGDFTFVPIPSSSPSASEDRRREKKEIAASCAGTAPTAFHTRGTEPAYDPVPLQHCGTPAQSVTPTPSRVREALIPARQFDSGDMLMVAGLLAHPESALKV